MKFLILTVSALLLWSCSERFASIANANEVNADEKAGRFRKEANTTVTEQKTNRCNCFDPCFKSSESDAFVKALTNAANYKPNDTLVLNICAGETISIDTGTAWDLNWHIALKNNRPAPACTKYELIINCVGGQRNCRMNYIGKNIVNGKALMDFATTSDKGATLAVTLNGIKLSSTKDYIWKVFFELPYYHTSFPDCFHTVSGPFQVLPPNVQVPFFFH
jgi:hypothetical protein